MKMSVAMCTYNGARFVRAQLESIAAQTRIPNELVVSDDCSEDATREIIADFATSAPFPVHLRVNERNLGSTKNFERAIELCDGDAIALSDQDDVWFPEKLRRIEDCFVQRPEVGLVFTDAEVVDEQLQSLGYRLWESVGFDNTQRQFVRAGRVLDVLLPGWTVTGATMAFRARFRGLVLEIPSNLRLIHDGWIALMIASVADICFIEEPLIKYRQHSRQQIGANERKMHQGAGIGLVGAKNAMQRKNSYQEIIEIGTEAQRRLSERSDVYNSNEALSKLEARLSHLRARASLPQKKLSRAPFVFKELLSRRYHLYSNGVYSAIKDLLA
jgi:glycosyltransferase involved in cell wall biosynthesis